MCSAGPSKAYGETLIQQPLVWRLQPEALLFGIVLGVVVSAVFGVMPVLTAVRIRPGIILRPNETHIPRTGVIHSILVLLFVVLALGLIAGQDHQQYDLGMIFTAATLLILGILIGLLWIVVWLVGRIPSFGNVDLRLALRNLRARRLRTATTLLALSAGYVRPQQHRLLRPRGAPDHANHPDRGAGRQRDDLHLDPASHLQPA